MSRIEEKNNEDKEEVLIFGTEEGDEIRMLLNMRKGRLHREKKDRVVMDFKKRAFSLKFYLCNLCKHLLQTKIL